MSDDLRTALARHLGKSGFVRPVGNPPDHDRAWRRMLIEADAILALPEMRRALAPFRGVRGGDDDPDQYVNVDVK